MIFFYYFLLLQVTSNVTVVHIEQTIFRLSLCQLATFDVWEYKAFKFLVLNNHVFEGSKPICSPYLVLLRGDRKVWISSWGLWDGWALNSRGVGGFLGKLFLKGEVWVLGMGRHFCSAAEILGWYTGITMQLGTWGSGDFWLPPFCQCDLCSFSGSFFPYPLSSWCLR